MLESNLHHPINDFDSSFVSSRPEHTARLMEAFRQTGICFDITINGPKDHPDEENFDVFWFHRDADKDLLNSVIREIYSEETESAGPLA